MKKIYLSIITCILSTFAANAQLTLTKAFNEPVVGDVNITKEYDSVSVIPKNTGSNQVWNFTAFTQNTVTASKIYTTAAAVPSSSNYAGCNLVEDQGASSYVYMKTTSTPTTQMELLGLQTGTIVSFNFTNSAIGVVWPVAMGYTLSDNFSGNANSSFGAGTTNGTITNQATGTGTLNLPGSTNLTNVLQTVGTLTLNAILGTAPFQFTLDITNKTYTYFHSSSKFAIAEIKYEKQSLVSMGGPSVTTSASIKINTVVITGINDKNFDATFQIFPNPATNLVTVNLTNTTNSNGSIKIINNLGSIVKIIDLGNDAIINKEISINDLPKGIYFVKTHLGNSSSSRKLIIN